MTSEEPELKPRERKRRARRRQVLNTAMEMVVASGLEGLTIARLAEKLGVSVGGLYRYYPNKGAILMALQQQAAEDFQDSLIRRLKGVDQGLENADEKVSALARVGVAFVSYLDHAVDAPAQHRLIDESISAPESLLSEEEARAVNMVMQPLLTLLGTQIDEAVACGALQPGDSDERTYLLWAFVHGMDHFRKTDRIRPDKLHTSKLLRGGVRAMMIGWGASALSADRAIELTSQLGDDADDFLESIDDSVSPE